MIQSEKTSDATVGTPIAHQVAVVGDEERLRAHTAAARMSSGQTR